MPDFQNEQPQSAEDFRTVPNASASFGSVPHRSETFRRVPHAAETFRTIPHPSERNENHTLTVREAARMFEAAGVARTERSIVNWCQLNRSGVARLDSYFDPNERKYYISPQSVEAAIQEEIQKATKINESPETFGKVSQGSEGFRTVPHPAESEKNTEPPSETNQSRVRELEKEVMDLKITNRGKDFFIEQLQKERNDMLEKVVNASRMVGELENKLLGLESPKSNFQQE